MQLSYLVPGWHPPVVRDHLLNTLLDFWLSGHNLVLQYLVRSSLRIIVTPLRCFGIRLVFP